ncbi:HAD family hydrolase [Haloferula sp. A504]|uniref:HAD family hydrolase n=1 Tax=Haloferula sp. A504 TaxID=3373601 RepID=UPI0031CB8790|nr:HAD family hydrolase [Verrucomicrobiaceae bacterium E54]
MIPAPTKAILFDVYGTLLDGPRHPDRRNRMASVIKRFELPEFPYPDTTFDQAIATAHQQSPERWPEIDIREIWQSIFPTLTDAGDFAFELEESIHPVEPTPWANRLLEASVETGAALGIVSNAQAYTRRLLATHFPEYWPQFRPDLCAFSYEHGFAKPDLRLFRHAVRPLIESGIAPAEILMVGDSDENDRKPAAELGLGYLTVPPPNDDEGIACG